MVGQEGRPAQHNAFASYIDFYQAVHGHTSHEVRPAGRTGARLLYAEQAPEDWSDAASPDLVVSVHVRHTIDLTLDIGGGALRQTLRPGSLAIVAPGVATTFVVDQAHHLQLLAIPYAALYQLSGPDTPLPMDGDFGWVHRRPLRDSAIAELLGRLWSESANDSPHGALWADGAILQIAARLAALKSGTVEPPDQTRRQLSATRLQRAADCLRADLERDIGLAEVASAAGMSPFHFARQFRARYGVSPIRYRIAARIEVAQMLLRTTKLPVAEVAWRVGYGDVSRFTGHFKRQTGATPGAWRAG